MFIISGFLIAFPLLIIFLLIIAAKSTYLVQQAEVIVIERLGEFNRVLTSGLNIVIPFVDKPRKTLWQFAQEDARGKILRYIEYVERLDLRETVYDFPKQNVITKDNVTIEINALLYYQVTDPKAAVYEVSNLPQAIEKLTQTTLRNVIGSMDLDETLTSRDRINQRLRETLDDATDKWGLKVNRVELQEINPPHDIRAAMEKQMRAERDRRALILEAEGEKSASVLQAEGKKTAAILEAEGKKNAAILDAEGERVSRISRAQGEAEAKLLIAKAEAESIELIKAAMPSGNPLSYMLATNYIKMLPEITRDKNSKVILMPYESSAMMGSLTSIKELFTQ